MVVLQYDGAAVVTAVGHGAGETEDGTGLEGSPGGGSGRGERLVVKTVVLENFHRLAQHLVVGGDKQVGGDAAATVDGAVVDECLIGMLTGLGGQRADGTAAAHLTEISIA